jgi:nucleoside-diphosphate-sugar epimerase
MKTDIMVSGSTGFVGRNLTPFLEKGGWKVIPLLRKQNTKNTITYDRLDKTDFDQSNAFIHLAGKANDLKNTSLDEEYYEVNTELTKTLFDLFLESNCKTFIYFSSVKAVADQADEVLTEDHAYEPKSVYGKSKALAEQYLLSKELPQDKKLYIVRPCMIHGPGNKGNLNLLYNLVSRGVPWPLGAFENKRFFLSIENLCFVIKELLDNTAISSGIYNIADDDALSTNQLIILMNEVVGKKPRFLKISRKGISMIAKIGELLYLPLNSEKLQKLTESYVVSNEKIKKALKIDKLPISASEGILKTIHSFKKQ